MANNSPSLEDEFIKLNYDNINNNNNNSNDNNDENASIVIKRQASMDERAAEPSPMQQSSSYTHHDHDHQHLPHSSKHSRFPKHHYNTASRPSFAKRSHQKRYGSPMRRHSLTHTAAVIPQHAGVSIRKVLTASSISPISVSSLGFDTASVNESSRTNKHAFDREHSIKSATTILITQTQRGKKV